MTQGKKPSPVIDKGFRPGHPLAGVGLHRMDEHGRVQNQAMVLDVISSGSTELGDLALIQYYSWIWGEPTTRALIPLREIATPTWVLYANTEDMNAHYSAVDARRNQLINDRLERERAEQEGKA